jgi:hypothetical protein
LIADSRGEHFAQNTLFSRRRSRRRPRSQGQYSLPDWAWGLAIGGVVVIIGGGFFLFVGIGGSGGSTCDKELPRLPGPAAVTEQGFQDEDVLLAEVIGYLNQADLDNAFSTFYGDGHAFTHNIDPDVREADEEAAKELCEAVLELEGLLESDSPAAMAAAAADLREELRDAAEALGLARPGG